MTKPNAPERPKNTHEAFKRAWENYPSQDNEGYLPDRGGFKCGWYAGIDWLIGLGWASPERVKILTDAIEFHHECWIQGQVSCASECSRLCKALVEFQKGGA